MALCRSEQGSSLGIWLCCHPELTLSAPRFGGVSSITLECFIIAPQVNSALPTGPVGFEASDTSGDETSQCGLVETGGLPERFLSTKRDLMVVRNHHRLLLHLTGLSGTWKSHSS